MMEKLRELGETESIGVDFVKNMVGEDNLETQVKCLTKIIYMINNKHSEMFERIKKLENYIQTMILSNSKSPGKETDIDAQLPSPSVNQAKLIDEKLRMGVPWNRMPVLWIPDDFTNRCQNCCNGFGCFFARKDHCRKCGGLFCTDCVDNCAFVPPFYTNGKVPVCSACFNKLQ